MSKTKAMALLGMTKAKAALLRRGTDAKGVILGFENARRSGLVSWAIDAGYMTVRRDDSPGPATVFDPDKRSRLITTKAGLVALVASQDNPWDRLLSLGAGLPDLATKER